MLYDLYNDNKRRETTIKTVNFDEDVVTHIFDIQKLKPFSTYKSKLDIDLSKLHKFVRMTVVCYQTYPPTLEQVRNMSPYIESNMALSRYLKNLKEKYQK